MYTRKKFCSYILIFRAAALEGRSVWVTPGSATHAASHGYCGTERGGLWSHTACSASEPFAKEQ